MNDVLSSWLPTQLKDGWRLTKNREFCSIVNGYPCPSEGFNTNGEGIPIVRIRDITSGSTNTYFKGEYPSEQIINTNDLLIGMDGDFNVRLWSSGKALLNQRCCNVRCKDELIKKYLYFVLPIQLKIINELKNSTTVKHLNNEDILDAQIVIPNKYDHISKIVNYLDSKTKCIDRILSVLNDILEKIIAYRQSLITRAVTKGLDPNVEMQDRELEFIGKYPKHWKATTVGRIYLMSNGLSQSGEFFGHGFPFFSYGDVYKNYALPETPSGLVQSDEKERANCSILRGDVFFTRTSETVEELGMASTSLKNYENATFAGFLIRARPKINLIEPEFAKFYFRAACHRAFFEKNTNLVTRASLSQTLLTRLPVLIPPKEEQIKIYEYCQKQINSLDNLSLALQKQIKKMKEYRSSLISAAVTGQLAIDEEASA